MPAPGTLQRMANKDGSLQAREFLFLCEELAMKAVAPELRPPERKLMWTILQMHYGDPAVHFELQPMPARSQVELGLHLEGPLEKNDAWAAMLAERACELLPALGEGWELEEWTASWRRLHRVFPFERLTRELASEVGAALARAVEVLGPAMRAGVGDGLQG